MPITGLGSGQGTYIGTVRWKWHDDTGKVFSFDIPDVVYVKTLPFRILSPQCWSKSLHSPSYCTTTQEHIQLTWNDGANSRTIRLDTNSNVAIMHSACDYKACVAYIMQAQPPRESNWWCYPLHEISDDEDSDGDEHNDDTPDNTSLSPTAAPMMEPSPTSVTTPILRHSPTTVNFHDDELATKAPSA